MGEIQKETLMIKKEKHSFFEVFYDIYQKIPMDYLEGPIRQNILNGLFG